MSEIWSIWLGNVTRPVPVADVEVAAAVPMIWLPETVLAELPDNVGVTAIKKIIKQNAPYK